MSALLADISSSCRQTSSITNTTLCWQIYRRRWVRHDMGVGVSSTPNNGGTDRPATQKELLQAQLAAQEQLYLTVARVEQKLNDGFERVNLAVLGVAERMARLEGIRDA